MANATRAVQLAVASVHAADLVGALSEALASSGHDTHTPAEVVDIIDDTAPTASDPRAGDRRVPPST